jgi:hypothetical protein
VFFFDEAHLLFNDAPQVLLDKIEQVIRLIRSKGVGVYFVSQNPADIPDAVLGQLGNRVQHALRAFTPKDQKAVKTAAQTMRANPAFSTEQAIQELGTGEALISFLDEKGSPSVVERAMVIAPCSRMGPVSDDERNGLLNHSPLYGKYEEEVDRESAFEMLQQGVQVTTEQQSAPPAKGQQSGDDDGLLGGLKDILFGSTTARRQTRRYRADRGEKRGSPGHQSDRPRHAGQPAGRTQALKKPLIAEGGALPARPCASSARGLSGRSWRSATARR